LRDLGNITKVIGGEYSKYLGILVHYLIQQAKTPKQMFSTLWSAGKQHNSGFFYMPISIVQCFCIKVFVVLFKLINK